MSAEPTPTAPPLPQRRRREPALRTRAFGVTRPHRLDVFRALTDIEPGDEGVWRSDNPWRVPNFDTYSRDEVRLNVHLPKRDRGSGAWVGVLAGGWAKLAVTDPKEAWERLSWLGICPAPDADVRRLFGAACEGCGGSGFQQRKAAAVGEFGPARTLRRVCNCLPARIGSRTRGRGYGLNESPYGVGALNAFAQWAMLGTETIIAAEELVRAAYARLMPAGKGTLKYVAWLPVVPRTWEPLAHRRVGTHFAEVLTERQAALARIEATYRSPEAGRVPARYCDRRGFGFVGRESSRMHLRAIDCEAFDGPEPGACGPLRQLHDLGLALHDLDESASVVVIAYPVQ